MSIMTASSTWWLWADRVSRPYWATATAPSRRLSSDPARCVAPRWLSRTSIMTASRTSSPRAAGGFLQHKVGAQSPAGESQLRDGLKSFTSVYAVVEQNYAEPIAGDKADAAIYDGAIQ